MTPTAYWTRWTIAGVLFLVALRWVIINAIRTALK
jgi:hypothetical protein